MMREMECCALCEWEQKTFLPEFGGRILRASNVYPGDAFSRIGIVA